MKLSEEDIKLIKYEKRTAYIAAVFIISITGIMNLIAWLVGGFDESLNIILYFDFAMVLFALIIIYFLNRRLNNDLTESSKIFRIATI